MIVPARYSKMRIASSEAGLSKGYWIVWGLPIPDALEFRTYTEVVDTMDGGSSKQGYAYIKMRWRNMSREALWRINKFLEQSNGVLFITVDRTDANSPETNYVDCKGIPRVIDILPGEGISDKVYYPQVEMHINAVEILAEPAEF